MLRDRQTMLQREEHNEDLRDHEAGAADRLQRTE